MKDRGPHDSRNLSPSRQLLLEKRRKGQYAQIPDSRPASAPAVRPDHIPLSFAQSRLWFLHRLAGPTASYNVPLALRIDGPLNRTALEAALDDLVCRHESLRTIFSDGPEGPSQHVLAPSSARLVLTVEDADDASLPLLLEQASRYAFDLAHDLPVRVSLFTLAPDQHVLLLLMHHIACDAGSLGPLQRDLAIAYGARVRGQDPAFPPLPLQYADYTLWQREQLGDPDDAGSAMARQMAYWRDALAGMPEELDLPRARARTSIDTFHSDTVTFRIAPDLHRALLLLAQRTQTSFYMIVQAALAVLLARLGTHADIPIGGPISGRTDERLEGLVGLFLNTLVFRTDTSGNPSFRALLERVRRSNLAAYAHQDLPFELLVEALNPPRALNRHPLAQIALTLQGDEIKGFELPGLTVTPEPVRGLQAKFDLSVHLAVERDADGIARGARGVVTYIADLFDRGSIVRMTERLVRICEAVVAEPDRPIDAIEILAPDERHQILHEWNRDVSLEERCVHELFEEQARQTPDAVALVSGDRAFSYGALNRRANQLAHYLRAQGVGPDTRVAMCLERDAELVVVFLAVLKAGGCYVPLDPTYPPERLRWMVADSAPAVVLTSSEWAGVFAGRAHVVAFDTLDAADAPWRAMPSANVPASSVGLTPRHLAYVLYTSGSTGTPKGVMVEHRAVQRLVAADNGFATFDRASTVAFASNPVFDATTLEIWAPLLNGGRLVVIDRHTLLDPERFGAALARHRVTTLWLTVGLFNQYVDALATEFGRLVHLIVGGDALDPRAIARLLQHGGPRHLLNGYGPTETTTFALTHEIAAVDDATRSIPIGRPIGNTRVYLLDRGGSPVPAGVTGELYIGGAGVARGYLNQPVLTAERFTPDPFVADATARMYRTGDLGRWQPDGTIEFLGRRDFQLKLRGFRIELGEIEAQLARQPGVRDVVVVARHESADDKRLVAYYTTRETNEAADAETLRAALSATLPAYMIPAAYVHLPAFPLTPNGKLDRSALPEPAAESYAARGFEAPIGDIETALASIWAELLRVERVGRHDNFFELGGHSLLALRVVTRAQQALAVRIGIEDLFARPVLADLARGLAHAAPSELPPIVPAVRGEMVPLSFAQQRLWFVSQMEGASEAYHIVLGLRLHGRLHRDALVGALNRIVARHEALRTTFPSWEGEATQRIAPPEESRLELVDEAWADAADPAALERVVLEESRAPFDLARGPLVRGRLIRQAADRHVLLVAMHHIVSDGWSTGIFLSELSALYGACVRGDADPLPPLAVQYADYAIWQRQWLDGDVLRRQAEYWQTTLRDAPALLDVPTDRPRSAVRDFGGDRVSVVFGPELTAGLKALGQQHGCTLFMTLLAGWAALLGRVASQDDVVIGTPAANRRPAEIEGLIGFFINTLALRIDLAGMPTVSALLARAKQQAVGAQQHQDLPFEQVVDLVQPTRSLSHSPLLQVTFTWQNIPRTTADLVGLDVQPLGAAGIRPASKYDLMLLLQESGDRITGAVTYSTALFDRSTIERYVAYFHRLLAGMASNAQQPVDELPLLSDDERAQILYEWNRSAEAHPREQCIHELFEAQAARTPDAVAIVSGNCALTYDTLNRQANQLAHYLRAHGVGAETPVVTCLERGVDLVVAIVAALKAGGCYVPLDPTFPLERLRWMVNDSAPAVLLTTSERAGLLADLTPVVALDEPDAAWRTMPSTNPPPVPGLTARNLAYVLYTSGSTGTPKGVMVDHRAVQRLVAANNGFAAFDASDRVAFASNPSFDATTLELWVPLLNGGALVVVDQHTLLDAARFGEALTRHAVTVLWLTVGLFNQYVDALAGPFGRLAHLLVGGDVLDPRAIARLQQRGAPRHLLNGYGPTETTTFALTHDIGTIVDSARSIPVGRPVADRRVYILDRRGLPTPIGVAGELHIGGAGVARGYLNQPMLTAERFLPDPFVADPTARMYRTGDLGRWQADGTIEFLGRRDFQLKLRGFRIELGEIEAHLAAQPGVRSVAVVAREEADGDKRLVAYYTAREAAAAPDAEALRTALSAALPAYMVPAAFVRLSAFPLTPNGKLDRAALPAPDVDAYAARGYEAPIGDVETALAAIWAELLHVERVGRHDNFFELGGHSLLAVRAIARAQQALGVDLDIGDLFAWPVLAELSQHVAQVAPLELPPITPAARGERVPLSFAQQRLWFLAQMEGVSETYHIALGMRLNGSLDRSALIAALDRIVWRHEGLRTTFGAHDGEATQQIAPAAAARFHLVEHDLDAIDGVAAERALERLVAEESEAPFDLVRGPLIRGRLIRLAPDRHVLLVTMHHIVSDGWSTGILLNELSALYGAYVRGEADPLPPLTLHYADYAIWQRRWLDGDVLQRQAAYWQTALQDVPTLLAVPGDRVRPVAQDYTGAREEIVLDATLTAGLKALSQRHGCTLYMTLLAGWAALLGRLAGQTDVVIGTPAANRRRTEIEGLIGFFVNTLAVRIDLGGSPTVSALLARVTQQAVGAQQHQDLPFEQVVELLQPVRSLSHTPLFQVMFAWQNAPRGTVDLAGLDVQPLGSAGPRPTSKFDLGLSLQESGGRINGSVAYATSLFDRSTIERYLGYFRNLLEAMVADAQQVVDRLPLLPDAERTQILYEWNRRGDSYPRHQGIHELFEDQAERAPDAVAVVASGHALSYGALDRRTSQLAHYLRARGVGPQTLVGTAFTRSLDAIVSMVGILKAGGAYLPLDPDYPIERLEFILADARPACVLTTSAIRSRLPETFPCLALDDAAIAADLDAQSTDSLERRADIAAVPAYVIYTSGSTGQPKGVVAPHGGLVNLVWDQLEAMAMKRSSRLLQCAPLNFDVAVTEITRTLAAGATLVLPRPEERVGDALAETIRRQQITHVTLSPRAMATLPEVDLPIETLVTGIEPCPGALVERWSRGRRMLNGYGPTETTVCSTITGALTGREAPSIGRPIANTQMYVLDDGMQPVPVGVAGELYIGGAGVTQGYLNRPVLTAERFVPDPFGAGAGARLYRTGDLGKWRRDGTIEFLGRNDFQVKIRGFRVELGEIEAQLVEQDGVGEAVVVARDEAAGEKRLVAYYTTRKRAHVSRIDAETLRRSLSAALPDYMVPAAYVRMDDLPRTLNGKVNRHALPAPSDEAYAARGYEAPVGDVETALAAIWAEALHVERVGRHDNFFELGGHSLLAVKVVEQMRRRGLRVDVRTLFSAPTLADLAAIDAGPPALSVPPPRIPADCDAITPDMLPLVDLSADAIATIVRTVAGGARNVQDIYPLAPLQEGILFHHLMDRTRDPYLGALQVSFDSRARLDAYLDALRAVIDRHDILRTAVVWEGLAVPVQVVWRRVTLPVEEVELDEANGPIAEQLYERFHPLHYRMELGRAPLMRIYVAHLRAPERWVVLKLFHHLAGDHSTLDVMQAEIKAHLLGRAGQLSAPMPYRNWVAQMRHDMASDQHEAYFRRMLADVEAPTAAFGLLNVQGDGRSIGDAQVAIDPALARRIRERARALKVSAASLWHLAFAQVLARASGRADVVFGTVLFGRLQGAIGGDGVMGLFINTLPLRIQVSDDGVETTARGVHAQLSELLLHEHASLSFVQRCSGVKAPAPLFAAVLNYRHQPRRKTPTPDTPQASHGIELLRAQERSNYPLALSVEDMGDDFMITTQVQAPVDPMRVCEYLCIAIESLIDALETAPERPVCAMPVLPDAEWQQYRTADRGVESLERSELPAAGAQGAREYEAPVGDVEAALAAIWVELLQVDRVGRHDNFFERGGHSLVAVRLVLRVHQVFGVELEIGDLFARPVLADLARRLTHTAPSELPPVTPAVRDERVPLSFAQQRLWFLSQIEGVSETYHISVGLRLNGRLHRDALVGALNRIVWRHEALRTTFDMRDGETTQRMTPPEHSRFELVEHTSADVDDATLERLVGEESRAPFDLVRGPLIRGRLIRLAPDRHALLITMHHIVSDGWSMGVFLSELGTLYGAYVRGEIDPLPPLTLQYADYAIWQRRWLDGEVLQRQAAYWQTALADAPTLLTVPGDRVRPAVQEFAADVVSVSLTPELTTALKALCQRHGCTLYMALLTAWAALLGRVAGQTEVVIGTPIANRRRTEIEGLIGFFVNTLAVRIDLGGSPTVGALLARVTERAVGAQQHQDLPFEQVVEIVQPVRSLSHTPLFQVMFAWQNVPKTTTAMAGLDVQPLGSPGLRPTSKFDMSLSLQQSGDAIVGGVAFATSLFERRTIERYLGYFHTLLEAMVADAHQVVDRLPLLPDAERDQVLYAWNRRETYPRRLRMHELFEEWAERAPDAVAVVDGERTLSYGALDRRTNQLAHYLRDLGVGPETLIGTAFNRSLEAIVSTVAILKAGGAYLPLDQEYPIERLNFIIDDARPAYVLTTSAIRDRLPASATCPSLAIDDATVVAELENSPASRLDREARSLHEPAYVIYTSGSTGQPKGVVATHDGLVNLATAHIQDMELGPASRFLQFASLNFDAAVVELAWALTHGAALVVPGPDERIGPALGDLMQRRQVTHVLLSPRVIATLPDVDLPLETLITGIEPCPGALVERWSRGRRMVNAYGPTEITVISSMTGALTGREAPSIGRPIANTQMYVLDAHLQPAPVRVAGELYIGGVGVTQGYLNRPTLTAERFVPDPFGAVAGARLYRTGDLAKWRDDGTIEFVGRNDFQVKIRGFRVELGEIEARLLEQPGVREAIVVAREETAGDARLVAYYTTRVADKGPDAIALRSALSAMLPEHMVPVAYVRMDDLPRTLNGKLNRKALPAPSGEAYGARTYEAPVGEMEMALAAIWADVMHVERVSRHDNFFELGGHSLLAIKIIERLRSINVHVDVRDMFASPTLAALAAAVDPQRALFEAPPNRIPDIAETIVDAENVIELRL